MVVTCVIVCVCVCVCVCMCVCVRKHLLPKIYMCLIHVCVFVCVYEYDVCNFCVYFDSVFVSQEKKRKKNERWVKRVFFLLWRRKKAKIGIGTHQ